MPRDVLDDLLNALVPLATEALEDHGRLPPIAAVFSSVGDLRVLAPAPLDQLTAALQSEARSGQLDATGLCLDFRLDPAEGLPATDAICCQLESRLGESIAVYLPYTLHPDREPEDRVQLGELMATLHPAQFFRAPDRKRS